MLVRLAVVIVAAGLTAGCFEPLYGRNPAAPDTDSVRDKLAEIDIPIIPTRQGSPEARIAVSMRNALQYDLNGSAGANAPTHRLTMTVAPTSLTVIVDPVTGRPTADIDGVAVNYQLTEIATGKVVLRDSAYSHVGVDSPGTATALRPAARQARRRRPRRADRRRGDPQSAGVLFRRRHVTCFVI